MNIFLTLNDQLLSNKNIKFMGHSKFTCFFKIHSFLFEILIFMNTCVYLNFLAFYKLPLIMRNWILQNSITFAIM